MSAVFYESPSFVGFATVNSLMKTLACTKTSYCVFTAAIYGWLALRTADCAKMLSSIRGLLCTDCCSDFVEFIAKFVAGNSGLCSRFTLTCSCLAYYFCLCDAEPLTLLLGKFSLPSSFVEGPLELEISNVGSCWMF